MMRFFGFAVVVVGAFAAVVCRAADDAILTPQKKAHWAWQAPQRPQLPTVKQTAWPTNDIDRFILAKLEENHLKPAPPADPTTLIRRLYFDLIGLPPTPGEVEEFVAAWDAPSAKKQAILGILIDRLLDSPHYGERWGRHWLDLARYAESNGYEFDEVRPDAWRYRDYVIRAFNSDKPYDRFLLEQLAGDELFPDDADARIATGFNLLGPDMTDSSNQAQRRQNTLDDMTDTAGLVFMGLTLGCARCHDHKFEPIVQADFYRVQAFFAPAKFRTDVPVASKQQLAQHAAAQQKHQALIQPTLDAQARLEAPYRAQVRETKLARIADEARLAHDTPENKRTPRQQELVNQTARLIVVTANDVVAVMSKEDRTEYEKLRQKLQQFDAQKPKAPPVAMALQDDVVAARTFLLERGELTQRGPEIEPAWPLILSPRQQEMRPKFVPPTPRTTGRRTALARWLVDAQHPLTARVMVNRLWQHHFGRGIVATPSDFGLRGEAPTHPELLDWLATEFINPSLSPDSQNRAGQVPWSIKRMHKLMLASATYQQSTAVSKATLAKDPNNEFFSRMNRRRLEGEIIRDSLLAVSGRLNPKLGGPSIFPPLPPEAKVTAKDWPVTADRTEQARRSIYIFARRNLRFPFLENFDLPDSNQSCPKRQQSTTGPQALALLNSADVTAAAQAMAVRIHEEINGRDAQIAMAFRLAYARRPSEVELREACEFLRTSPLSEMCRALLNTNEFAYVD